MELVSLNSAAATTLGTVVKKMEMFDENGAAVKDPTVTLTCYRTKPVPGQGGFASRSATLTNQFGTQTVTVAKPRTLCVPSEVTP